MGGLDIYKAEKGANGDWGAAVNLGSKINTVYDEETPFLVDDKTLFFSSEGHSSIGGFDIFYSKKNDKGEWTEPVNPGYNFNTTDDNLFFEPILDGTSGFLALTGEDATGERDIYKIILAPFKEEIAQTDTKQDQNTKIETKTETKVETKTETKTETKVETKTEVKKETKADTKNNNANKSNASYKFTIQIAASTQEENPYGFISLKGIKQNKSKRSMYIYTYGEYQSYTAAFNDLHKAQDMGFKDAFIIGYTKFCESNFEGGNESGNVKLIADIIKEKGPQIFAVQIASSKTQIEASFFKGANDVKSKLAKNGWYKFFTGKYENYDNALKEMKRLRAIGYADAFVIYWGE
jgi:cell division protein FtsN